MNDAVKDSKGIWHKQRFNKTKVSGNICLTKFILDFLKKIWSEV